MASILGAFNSIEYPTHHIGLSRHFFGAWQVRNEIRQDRWRAGNESGAGVRGDKNQAGQAITTGAIRFSSLHQKIQHLKEEIIGLMAQDTALFHQLFALQEAVMEFREQLEGSSDSYSSDSSSCSSRDGSSGQDTEKPRNNRSASFVRHRVSYPPIARNRSHRVKTSTHHGCQDSYDSGIHNSDLEIFV